MNIEKYFAYFHDGWICEIQQVGDRLSLSMVSADMDPKEMTDNIPLSSHGSIDGKLHILGVSSIKSECDLEVFYTKLEETKNFEIFNLGLSYLDNQKIRIELMGEFFRDDNFYIIEIKAKEIYWEPIPNLSDKEFASS
jgi:hypothetical protein